MLRERSADIGSFLIETLQAMKLSSPATPSSARPSGSARRIARSSARSCRCNGCRIMSGGLPGLVLSAVTGAVFVYGGLRVIEGTLTVGTFVAFMAYKMRFMPLARGADGALRQRGHCARLVAARLRGARYAGGGRGAC